MAIFAFADTHLSLGGSKPMDIFPGWDNHVARMQSCWERIVRPEDTVVLAGDISWGMDLNAAKKDFAFLDRLPGRKLIVKGNHDYWWSTANKIQNFWKENGFTTFELLHNNAIQAEGVWLCGTRSWLFDPGEPHDEKIMNRELGRLKFSLDAAGEGEKIVFLHYPPVYTNANSPEVVNMLKQYGIRECYYGHLHGKSIHYAVQGEVDGISYRLISADGLGFCPLKIR